MTDADAGEVFSALNLALGGPNEEDVLVGPAWIEEKYGIQEQLTILTEIHESLAVDAEFLSASAPLKVHHSLVRVEA